MKVSLAAIAVMVLCQLARAEQPASNTSPLDAAKRDLGTLPAATSPDLVRKTSGLGEAALPVSTAPTAPSPAPGTTPQPSETWLQDALDAVKTEKAAAQKHGTPLPSPQPGALNVPKSPRTVDPLDRYLTQWLNPRDLEVLRPGTGKDQPGQAKPPLDFNALGFDSAQSATGTITPPPFASPAAAPLPVNPYLQDPEPLVPAATALPTAMHPVALPVGTTPPARQAGSTADPNTGTATTPTMQPQSTPTPVPPPTAPVVNDRKYFPQLRRF